MRRATAVASIISALVLASGINPTPQELAHPRGALHSPAAGHATDVHEPYLGCRRGLPEHPRLTASTTLANRPPR